MKKILISFFILWSSTLFCQDPKMLSIINTYRKLNNSTQLTWSDKLGEIAENQSLRMSEDDKTSHSDLVPEIVNIGVNLPSFGKDLINFKSFLKEFFNIEWSNPKTVDEAEKLCKYFCIYIFHQYSPGHKELLLSKKFKEVGFSIIIKGIKITEYSCELKSYCTITFN